MTILPGQVEIKGCPPTHYTFSPDFTSMAFNNTGNITQTDAGAGKFCGFMQALKGSI
jgi:hypothetical protein